jgi:hypothetical protein
MVVMAYGGAQSLDLGLRCRTVEIGHHASAGNSSSSD